MRLAPRTRAQRKADTLALLRTEVDGWVASADEMGNAHLVTPSHYWTARRSSYLQTAPWGAETRSLIRFDSSLRSAIKHGFRIIRWHPLNPEAAALT